MIDCLYPPFKHWSEKGTIWIYSDPHFGDKDLPYRPSDEEQIKLINSKVGKKDTLIILGDVGDADAMKKVRGYKVLIAGNHDTGLSKYSEVFNEIYDGVLFVSEKIVFSHEPIEGIKWAFNFHGHIHDTKHKDDKYHMNCCAEHIDYTPVNFNQFIKRSGKLAPIQSIHRITIDKATKRKQTKGKRYES